MKRFAFLLLMIPAIVYGQKQKDPSEDAVNAVYLALPKVDSQFEWTEIVQADSLLKKDDLYRNAKIFFANELKSPEDVIQYDDPDARKVVGKGSFHLEDSQFAMLFSYTDSREVNFTLEIYCMDGKYKYRIYNINADCRIGTSSGRGPVNSTKLNMTLDDAYNRCLKGISKKMERRLFIDMIYDIQYTVDDVKKAMAVKKGNNAF
jgi:hypothetical protein